MKPYELLQTNLTNIWNAPIYVTFEDRPDKDAHEFTIEHPATEEDVAWQFHTNHGQLDAPEEGQGFVLGQYIKSSSFVTTQKELDKQAAWVKIHGPLDNPNQWFKYVYKDKIVDLIPEGTLILKDIK